MSEISDERLAELIDLATPMRLAPNEMYLIPASAIAALRELQSARQRIAVLTEALRKARGHTTRRPNATRTLLHELLDSVQRITDAALSGSANG